ncbi:hypothetical protein ACFL1Y_00005, partial [Patescibacteria group bacterium]
AVVAWGGAIIFFKVVLADTVKVAFTRAALYLFENADEKTKEMYFRWLTNKSMCLEEIYAQLKAHFDQVDSEKK